MRSLAKNPLEKLLAVVTLVGATSAGAIAAPRTLANGAPAPGNTVAKGERAPDRAARVLRNARAELVAAITAAKRARHQLASQPRTLPNGAPACGNVGTKAPCTVERAKRLYEIRITRAREAEEAVARAREKVHEATRRFALAKQRMDDDYS